MMLLGNDCWNKNVFRRWRKVEIDGDDWTWTGKEFQTMEAATRNEWRPTETEMCTQSINTTYLWKIYLPGSPSFRMHQLIGVACYGVLEPPTFSFVAVHFRPNKVWEPTLQYCLLWDDSSADPYTPQSPAHKPITKLLMPISLSVFVARIS